MPSRDECERIPPPAGVGGFHVAGLKLIDFFDRIYLPMDENRQVHFFPLKKEHIQEILEIENRSFPEPWSRNMFEREISLPISHFFVLVPVVAAFSSPEDIGKGEKSNVIGYGGYWLIHDEAHINSLAIHPHYREKGFGKKTLDYLIDSAILKGAKKALLEVRERNISAIRLYESRGFIKVGFRAQYYKDEGAVLMEKPLHITCRQP